MTEPTCDCWKFEAQVCDVCLPDEAEMEAIYQDVKDNPPTPWEKIRLHSAIARRLDVRFPQAGKIFHDSVDRERRKLVQEVKDESHP